MRAASWRELRELVALAWPAILSYILNNAYRVNDQYWVRGLGGSAQTAIAATFFVQLLSFAVVFLAVGGTLALVSRATGARDSRERDSIVRHALLFAALLGIALQVLVTAALPAIVGVLGLSDAPAADAESYLSSLYRFMVPLALFPVMDAVFIGRGNTRVPMALQGLAVGMNYLLNPLLIYGSGADAMGADAMGSPGAELVARVAAALSIEGAGISGAATATGIARTTSLAIGLLILRFGFGTSPLGRGRPRLAPIAAVARIGAPVSASIAVYALAYWLLFGLVLSRLGDGAMAGLGLGFQVFEGVAFPCYLGVSIAGASLVGRAIGARDPGLAWRYVKSVRLAARVLGLAFATIFLFAHPLLIPIFAADPIVARETGLYVLVLAFSQYHVAVETANEKVLLGSGQTRGILWISPLGNLLRPPLAFLLAIGLDLGAAGVWWAINLTTYLKAYLFWRLVQTGRWLDAALSR